MDASAIARRAASRWSRTPPRRSAPPTRPPVAAWADAATPVVLPDQEPRRLRRRRHGADHPRRRGRARPPAPRPRRPRQYGTSSSASCSRLDELQAALLRVKLRAPGRVERAPPRDRPPLRDRARRPAARPAGGAAAPPTHLPPVHGAVAPSARRSRRPRRTRRRHRRPLPEHGPRPAALRTADAEPRLPGATQAAAEVLCLPCFPELLDPEVDQVVDAIKRALAQVMRGDAARRAGRLSRMD